MDLGTVFVRLFAFYIFVLLSDVHLFLIRLLVGPGNIWGEVLLLALDAASIVALMAIGHGIAKLGIGRISVTAVGREDI